MLHVVIAGEKCPQECASRFTEDLSRGVVVLESDLPLRNGSFIEAHDELQSNEAKQRALGFANSHGVGDARINGIAAAVYPVNSEGLPLDRVRGEKGEQLPPVHPRMQVWRYRADFPVTRRLV